MPHQFPKAGDDKGAMSIAQVTAIETTAGTLIEAQLSLPTNPSDLIAVLLYRIKFAGTPGVPSTLPAADDIVLSQVRGRLNFQQGLGALPDMVVTAGSLAQYDINTVSASAPADAGGSAMIYEQGRDWDFGPGGLLIVDRTVSLYVQGSSLFNSVSRVQAMLYYRLVEISATDLIAAVTTVADIS